MRFFIGLSVTHSLLVTSKLVNQFPWLPLTSELLSVSETEGEKKTRIYLIGLLSLRLLLTQNPPPSSEGGKQQRNIFIVYRLTFFEPRDYRVVFGTQKNSTPDEVCLNFYFFFLAVIFFSSPLMSLLMFSLCFIITKAPKNNAKKLHIRTKRIGKLPVLYSKKKVIMKVYTP